jgi:hypothetical protein
MTRAGDQAEESPASARDEQMMVAGVVTGFGIALLILTLLTPAASLLGMLAAAALSGVVTVAGVFIFIGARSASPEKDGLQ